MSALLQIPDCLQQPPVPRTDWVPVKLNWWVSEQPTGQRKKSAAAGEFDDVWQRLNREVAPGSALTALEDFYVIEGRSAVATFIEENRLRGLLLKAQRPLAAAFGDATVKTLTLVRDDEGFQTLFCLVMVPGTMEEARRALGSFDQWWRDRSEQTAGKLNFDFDLV